MGRHSSVWRGGLVALAVASCAEPTGSSSPPPPPADFVARLVTGHPEQAVFHEFDRIGGLTVDAEGRALVSDVRAHRVWRVDEDGGIVNVAGMGLPISAGDGGPASNASFEYPGALAVDGLGRLHVAEEAFIRRVEVDGTITTVAGNGVQGSDGDGGPATEARVWSPMALAFDGQGRLYFVDLFVFKLRRVELDGTIVTLTGASEATALAVDRAGRIYFVGNNRLARIDNDGNVTTVGPPANALAIDRDDRVLLSDWNEHRIQRLEPDGTLTTLAGTGTPGFVGDGGPATLAHLDRPWDLAVDASGRILIHDTDGERVRRIDENGVISTIAGRPPGITKPGPAIHARVGNADVPTGDGHGGLFVTHESVVRHIDDAGHLTHRVGSGWFGSSGDGRLAVEAELGRPSEVALDATGRLYIADRGTNRIRRVDEGGTITTVAGTGEPGFGGDEGPATSASFTPDAIAVDTRSRPIIVDTQDHRLRRVNSDGTMVTVAGTGVAGFSGDEGPATAARLELPQGVAVDDEGGFYIADRGNARVRYVNLAGIIRTVAGNGRGTFAGEGGPAVEASIAPHDVAVGEDGLVYIADGFNGRVYRVEADGTLTTIAGGNPGAAFDAEDGTPAMDAAMDAVAIAVDGPRIIVNDRGRIRSFTPGGTVTTLAGLRPPKGIAPLPTARLLPTGTMVAVDEHRIVSVGGLVPYTAALLDLEEEVVRTVVGAADAATIDGAFNEAHGAAFDPVVGSVLITESGTGGLHVLRDVAGPVSSWTLRSTSTSLVTPTGIAYDPTRDDFVVVEQGNHCVRRMDRSGSILGTVAGRCGVPGQPADRLDTPTQVLVSPRSGAIYVADTGNHRVLRLPGDGADAAIVVDDGNDATTAPHQMAMDDAGNLFVASTTVVRLVENIDGDADADADDRVVTIYGDTRDGYPEGDAWCLKALTLRGDGRVLVADACHGFVVELAPIP